MRRGLAGFPTRLCTIRRDGCAEEDKSACRPAYRTGPPRRRALTVRDVRSTRRRIGKVYHSCPDCREGGYATATEPPLVGSACKKIENRRRSETGATTGAVSMPLKRGPKLDQAASRDHGNGELFFDLDHDAAHVEATIGTDDVRRNRRAALRTIVQLLGLLGVMSPSAARPSVRLFAFGNCHRRSSIVGYCPARTYGVQQGLRSKPLIVSPCRQSCQVPNAGETTVRAARPATRRPVPARPRT